MRQAAMAGVHGLTRARVAALCLGALAAAFLALTNPGPASADGYPGQAEIDAAQAAADSQASTVGQLDAAVVSLEKALGDAQNNEALAGDRYVQALGERDAARTALESANQRSAEAQAALKQAQDDLASVAMAAYRDGGNMGQVSALLSANGFADAVTQSEAMSRASDATSVKVQRVEAAQLVASTLRAVADKAATRAADAEQAAKDSYDTAMAASAAAKRAVQDAAAAKAAAVTRLAELQGTTVALEKQRQDGLAAERQAARKAAALKAQKEAEATYQREQAAAAAAAKLKQEQADAAAAAAAAAAAKPTSTPKPTTTTTSNVVSTTTTTTSSGGSTPASTPASTSDPAPAPDPIPTTGAWRSTAAQGETAVAQALTMLGVPYLLGGNSMDGFDCSYLTMTSWKAAGYYIPRSAQWQYNALTHVPISQMRKGDLIFYGTNRSDSQIYHVAIYIGNGLVAEAASPGTDSLIRAYDAFWRIDNLIPYVGRP